MATRRRSSRRLSPGSPPGSEWVLNNWPTAMPMFSLGDWQALVADVVKAAGWSLAVEDVARQLRVVSRGCRG